MFGRRDRCLLVLSQIAGVPYKHLAMLARAMSPSLMASPS
jgi:hypothetical protein